MLAVGGVMLGYDGPPATLRLVVRRRRSVEKHLYKVAIEEEVDVATQELTDCTVRSR